MEVEYITFSVFLTIYFIHTVTDLASDEFVWLYSFDIKSPMPGLLALLSPENLVQKGASADKYRCLLSHY